MGNFAPDTGNCFGCRNAPADSAIRTAPIPSSEFREIEPIYSHGATIMLKHPPHPGKLLRDEYLKPRGISIAEAAKLIGVTRQAINNLVNGRAGVSPEMAMRLARLLNLNPETIQQWQKDYELHQSRLNRARRNRARTDSYLIGSSDLVSWAETIDARYTFPQLIRMLIRATAGVAVSIDFPTAEDAQRSGWDGIVESLNRTSYLPQGKSAWELSTELNPQGKANRDYDKRKADPGGLQPKDTTFVAVTARRWSQKRQWQAEKNAEKFWARVLAYDAVDLEQWLEWCPEVGIWFATRIGRRPRGVQSLESFWNEFRLSASPPMPPDLLLAGRNVEVEKLCQWLDGGTGVFRILADSADEALAFAAAVSVTRQDAIVLNRLGQTIVATDPEEVRQLMSVEHSLTFGWRLDDPSLLGTLIDEGHRAILPLGRSAVVVASPDVELPRLARGQFVTAIKNSLSGSSDEKEDRKWEDEANRRARMSGRSITVYRRLFASAGTAPIPSWATVDNAHHLVPIVLATGWSEENTADRLALAKLAGSEYERVSQTATRWKTQPDAPVRRIGSSWVLAAPLDSWSLVGRYIGETDLERYQQVVLEVLGEPDPKLELTPDERWLANLHGKEFKYSNSLREGLAESLILLAVVVEEAHQPELPICNRLSHRLVTNLLANKFNPTRWASLAGLLPRLAEAAPDAFLTSLADDLAMERPAVLSLFEEEGAPLRSGTRHPHLLWALEILSWYPDYLSRSALALARLDKIAPEIKIANRPQKSLSGIFCTWHRNTAASLDERLAAVDLLIQRFPHVAWELLLTLLPKFYDVSGNSAEPRWRPKQEVAALTYGEVWRAKDEFISRALRAAQGDGEKLSALVSEIGSWAPAQRESLLREFELFAETSKDLAERTRLWNTLREFVSRHRAYPDAEWSIPAADLVPFDALLPRFAPTASWESSLWLFDRDLPELTNVQTKSIQEAEKEANTRRQEVVSAVFLTEGLDGILRFARRVKMPWLVGGAAAESITDNTVDQQILDRVLGDREEPLWKFSLAFVIRRRELRGSKWSDAVLNSSSFKTWPTSKQAEFCLCLPEGPPTWQIVANLGSPVASEYWRKVYVAIVRFTDDEAQIAIDNLLQFGRAIRALEQGGSHPEKLSDATLVRVLESAIEELARADNLSDGAMLTYYLERIFHKLRQSQEIPAQLLGKLEWQYLPLLRFHASPVTLHTFLQQDPEFFATVVGHAFQSEIESDRQEGEEEKLGEQARNRARIAWELLESWHTPPGTNPDRSFSPDLLKDWVREARSFCAARHRSKIGDDRIGRVLAYVPADDDGAWPHVVLRELIEAAESPSLEAGIHAARINSRGVYTKDPLEGGRTERQLAKQYRSWAKTANTRWPRTARLLNSLAETYEQFGRHQDVSAERWDLD